MFVRRHLFLYETPEDGGGVVDDSEPVDDAAVADDAAATEQEAAAWALSQDDWQQTVQYLQQTAPIIQAAAQMLQAREQQQQAAPQQDSQLPEIDPFDPSSVGNYVDVLVQQKLQAAMSEQMGPYGGMLEMVAAEQGEALARQELENIRASIGEFDQDTAFLIAAGAIEGGQDPALALRNAATYSREWEQKIRADERERYTKEVQNLQTAPGEVPVGSSAGSEVQSVPTGPRRYHEVVERFQARQNPTSMVG